MLLVITSVSLSPALIARSTLSGRRSLHRVPMEIMRETDPRSAVDLVVYLVMELLFPLPGLGVPHISCGTSWPVFALLGTMSFRRAPHQNWNISPYCVFIEPLWQPLGQPYSEFCCQR